MAISTPVDGCRTAGWEMSSQTDWRMCGYARWSSTGITRNLRNAAAASCWPGAGAVPRWPAEGMEIFMRQIPSAGRRSMSMNEVMKTILHRRAVRRFQQRQVAEDALEQILEAGPYAPSAGGRQGVLFAVCQDRQVNERLGKIKRANSHFRMASGGNYISREQPRI